MSWIDIYNKYKKIYDVIKELMDKFPHIKVRIYHGPTFRKTDNMYELFRQAFLTNKASPMFIYNLVKQINPNELYNQLLMIPSNLRDKYLSTTIEIRRIVIPFWEAFGRLGKYKNNLINFVISEVQNIQKLLEGYKKEVTTLNQRLQQLQDENRQLMAVINKQRQELQQKQGYIATLQNKITKLESENKSLKTMISKQKNEIIQIKHTTEELKKQLLQKTKYIKDLKAQIVQQKQLTTIPVKAAITSKQEVKPASTTTRKLWIIMGLLLMAFIYSKQKGR